MYLYFEKVNIVFLYIMQHLDTSGTSKYYELANASTVSSCHINTASGVRHIIFINIFFIKDFSGTTEPRILKLDTNVGYDLLYCVRENHPPPAYHSLYLSIFLFSPIKISLTDFTASMRAKVFNFRKHLEHGQVYCGKGNQDAEINFCLLFPFSNVSFPLFVYFSFSPIKLFVTEFSAPFTARVFKFYVHFEGGQVYCGKENQDAVINFCLLFPFFLFFISHSNVIHREICVKDFSGTTVPRILKFSTNVGYDFLYCVKENQHAAAYYSFICPFFFLSKQNLHLQIVSTYL